MIYVMFSQPKAEMFKQIVDDSNNICRKEL